MDEKLTKSLTDLIDETLMELDELRKSRFAASEVKIEGPGDGIAGKPSNGDLHAKKAEDDKDEKDEDEKDEKDMDKAEGKNKSADPGPVHHGEGSDKGAGPREQSGGGKVRGHDGKNTEADPGEIHKADDKEDDKDDKKKDKDAKGGEKHEADEKKAIGKLADLAGMKKSFEESEALMKSFVEERVKPLEDKLSTILELVNKIADQPAAAPKGQTARATAAPLMKSGEGEPLSKAQVANKLFELKKSGTRVDSLDIAKAEMGQDLQQIVKKYEIS